MGPTGRQAEERRGEVSGHVLDETGDKPACAHVRLSSVAYARDCGTDASGRFRFDDVPFGPYRLEVRPCGAFASATPVSVGSAQVTLELRVAGPRAPCAVCPEPPYCTEGPQLAASRDVETQKGAIVSVGLAFGLDTVSDGEGGPSGRIVSPALFVGGPVSRKVSLGVFQSLGTADGVRGPGVVLGGAVRHSFRNSLGGMAFMGYRFRTSRSGSEPGQWVLGAAVDWRIDTWLARTPR